MTIGWLYDRPGGSARDFIDAFRRGLAEIGFLEGRDVTVEYHTADGHLERLPSLADDLVRRRVAVIFANLMTEAVMVCIVPPRCRSCRPYLRLSLKKRRSGGRWPFFAGISKPSPLRK